jgi:hypothetical protein
MFRTCTTATAPTDRKPIATLVKELKDIEYLETASARQKLDAAWALAEIELEQHFDERETYRNDPLRAELRRQQQRYAHTKSYAEVMAEQNQAASDIASDVAALAVAWSSVNEEKLAILRDELRDLEPIVEQVRLAARISKSENSTYTAQVSAWHAFSAGTVKALPPPEVLPSGTPRVVSVRKLCQGASKAYDFVIVKAVAGTDAPAIVAEFAFDKGGRQQAVLRRLSKGDEWVGRVDWPPASSRAAVDVRWAGNSKWAKKVGVIATQRTPIEQESRDAAGALREVEKKFKMTNFRAVGGDNIKTAPIF